MRKASTESSTACRSEREGLLVYAPNWLGDAVMAIPLLLVLRRLYPDMVIHLYCRGYVSEVFRRSSAVDRIVEHRGGKGIIERVRGLRAGRPKRGWSIGFVLPPSFSAALVTFLSGARRRIGYGGEFRRFLLTDDLDECYPRGEHLSRMYIRLAERAAGTRIIDTPLPVVVPPYRWRDTLSAQRLDAPYIVLAPGAVYGAAKVWPLARYAALAGRAAEHTGMGVLLIGTEAEAPHLAKIIESAAVPVRSLAGQLTGGELLAVLRGAALVVGNDSGPVHLAAAMGRPTVAIFGSTNPVWTAPRGAVVRIISHEIECSPCFRRECPDGEPRCLYDIEVDEVFDVSRELLEEVRCGETESFHP